MNYIELTVIVTPKEQGSDVLICRLAELGFESFMENGEGFTAYVQEEEYSEEEVALTFGDFSGTFSISHTARVIPQQNWNEEWESSFQPITVDGKCYIRAPFHEARAGYEYTVIIEPKMSFGTGHHDTTQLMLHQLMLLNVKTRPLLDMGCGTGVLAIVASMMGANPVTAVDIDEWSYGNTIENLQKNNINNVSVHKGGAEILQKKLFYTILANINKNVLLADLSAYTASLEANGNLVLSGFFETDMDELKDKAEGLGLKLQNKAISNQWAMLHFIKPV